VQAALMSSFNKFMENKKRQHERVVARHEKLGTSPSWRMRLRFHVFSKLNTDAKELKAEFCGRRIVFTSRTKGEPLNQAEWIVIVARRFKNAEAAARFGLDLQSAISAISAVRNIPIDVGFDNVATTTFGDVVKDAVAKTGAWLIDDVHGVDVYPDTQTAIVMAFGATLTTSFDPTRITDALKADGRRLTRLDDKGREAALLINAAFMAPHPVAMITLAVAAVELLAAGERWNTSQKQWIIGLQAHLEDSEGLSKEERGELRQAIDGLNHFGALSRTRRLLKTLGLDDMLERWDLLYRKRSRLFHGDKIIPFPQVQAMGGEARALGQAVVHAYIERGTGVKLN
jgi:hypothetical protein